MAICVTHGEEKVKSRCKYCHADYMRAYHRTRFANDAEYRERSRSAWGKWAKEHPDKRARATVKHRLKKYGLSETRYAEMLATQGGVCAICGGNDSRRLSIDHDHDTGVVRGLLCGKCNLGIGLIASPENLAAAQAYLSRQLATSRSN